MAMEKEKYKEIGLFTTPQKRLLYLLDLKQNEEILINLRVAPSRSIFINNIRERYAKRLVLTNERIFIINRGWILKGFIQFNKITDVLLTKKWDISSDFPVLIIKTDSDTYEIFFYASIFSRKKIRQKMEGILNCIKEGNPNINVKIDVQQDDNLIKEVLFTKIKFK